jgi:hypothetical protein
LSASCSLRSGSLRLVYILNTIEKLAQISFGDLNVIVVLQIEPKLCRCAQRLASANRRIGGNARLFAEDGLGGLVPEAPDHK